MTFSRCWPCPENLEAIYPVNVMELKQSWDTSSGRKWKKESRQSSALKWSLPLMGSLNWCGMGHFPCATGSMLSFMWMWMGSTVALPIP